MRVPTADPTRRSLPFLPTTRAEVEALGWDAPDVVFVTGDAYVDHPSFAMAILGRVLEAAGFRVAILSQPDWTDAAPFRSLGRPRLFFAVGAGNMDSMLNRYTAQRKPRSDDAYSPGGVAGRRPDRSTNVYAQRCREAFKGVPVIAGGVEASLRRFAHYDYWSDTVRPSILASSKADLVVFGMGEAPIVEIARRLDAGEEPRDLRDMRGVAFLLGAKEEMPPGFDAVALPSFEEVRDDVVQFAVATRHIHRESNPFNAKRLVQPHGDRTLVQNPPDLPLSKAEMDAIYDLPYARDAHPSYGEKVPALEMMRTSVTIMRGCFGGCTFCSITTHQGRVIQSRSKESVVREVEGIAARGDSKGIVSDVGGPTANMYEMRCTRPEVEAKCRRLSCVHPKICPLLGTDHGPLVDLLRAAREVDGVRRVHVASGVRMDLAKRSPEYLRDLAAHHVGGHLKVAPEHVDDEVLRLMKKPSIDDFERFGEAFAEASRAVGKEQYLVPYFIASHPGSTLESMIDLALFLKRNGYKPRQVQDFIPAPLDVATCMYHTGLDPMTMKPVPVATSSGAGMKSCTCRGLYPFRFRKSARS
ncbi:MAG: YgiQ family radical SAM protein, partial [Planctomycetota bacterium JB042]